MQRLSPRRTKPCAPCVSSRWITLLWFKFRHIRRVVRFRKASVTFGFTPDMELRFPGWKWFVWPSTQSASHHVCRLCTVGTAQSKCVFRISHSLKCDWEQRDVFKIHILYQYQNFAVSKVGSTIPAFMSQSASLFQTIFLTLEISPSHWSWAPVIGCFICLFVVCFDQRDRLWVPLMWGLSVIRNGSIGTGECPSWLIPYSVLLEPHPIKQ